MAPQGKKQKSYQTKKPVETMKPLKKIIIKK
jgi:hypothetical protein